MDNGLRQFRPLSSKASLPAPRSGANRKSHTLAPKQKKSPIKAPRKVAPPSVKHARATERRARCMETSAKLSKYFTKPADEPMGLDNPICLSEDDGEPTASQIDRDNRRREAKARFLDCEADHSSEDDQPQHTQGVEEEEEDQLTPGFIVSDGHLSDDESDDWAGIHFARRVSRVTPDTPPRRGSKEAEKERESPQMEWSPCGQPPSPPMSPVNLDLSLSDSDPEKTDDVEEEEEVVEPTPVVVEIEEPGEEIDTTKKFRLQNQYVLLTYKSHLPKDHYTEWLKDTMKIPNMWIRLAHETADKNCPYRHTHVVIDFGRRINVHNCHKFCYKNPDLPADKVDKCGAIHCNIRRLPGNQAFIDAKVYIAKEDRENADLQQSKEEQAKAKGLALVNSIQGATSVNVALRQNLRRISDAAGIIQIFQKRNLGQPNVRIPDRPDRPWHQELFTQVETERCAWGDRKIIWYVDKVGNSGKSWFSRYMSRAKRDESGFDWLCISAMDDPKEAYNQLLQAVDQGFNFKGFIIDVARGYKFKRGLYTALETFKNGQLTATKYQGGRLEFNTPWIIVFSNFWPKTEMMSADRWDIRRIDTQTGVAEHLPPDAEAPEEFKHCGTCQCTSHGRHEILQERL